MKLAIQHTPRGDCVHIVVKYIATDWSKIDEPKYQGEETACAIDLLDLNSPELGEAQFKNAYAPDLNLKDSELCPQCRAQIEKEIALLNKWNRQGEK